MDLGPLNYPHRRRIAIVLGAGASRGADFVKPHTICKPPLDADFFTILRASALHNHPDARRLLKFLEDEFGTLDVRMESFYSQSLLHDQFAGEIPHGKGKRRAYAWAIRYFRRLLPRLFAETFGTRMCQHHAALAALADARDSFISFNYDCLIDRALLGQAGNKWNPASGYGFVVSSGAEYWKDPEGSRGRPREHTIRLLKPHGSLNWRVTTRGDIALRRREYERRHEDELTIIPPLWQKSFEDVPFRDIWREIRIVLSSVKALMVVGYSLPETDVYTQAALRMDVDKLDFLCIANPDRDARTRVLRVLRGAVTPATYVVEFESLGHVAAALGER